MMLLKTAWLAASLITVAGAQTSTLSSVHSVSPAQGLTAENCLKQCIPNGINWFECALDTTWTNLYNCVCEQCSISPFNDISQLVQYIHDLTSSGCRWLDYCLVSSYSFLPTTWCNSLSTLPTQAPTVATPSMATTTPAPSIEDRTDLNCASTRNISQTCWFCAESAGTVSITGVNIDTASMTSRSSSATYTVLNNDKPVDDTGLGGLGTLIAVVTSVGLFVVACAIGCCVWRCCRKKRDRRKKELLAGLELQTPGGVHDPVRDREMSEVRTEDDGTAGDVGGGGGGDLPPPYSPR